MLRLFGKVDKMNSLMRCHRFIVKTPFRKFNLKPAYVLGSANIRKYSETPEKSSSINTPPVVKHKPNDLDKKILVWTKKYKSADEVPDTVSRETMEQAKSRARIKLTTYVMVITTGFSFLMIWWGKHDAHKGESVHKMNLDWHKSLSKNTAEK
ncbi:hypothetical protein CHUAL_013228 [Chamberlinius hualienensis]